MNPDLIKHANQSWLKFCTDALVDKGLNIIYQACDLTDDKGNLIESAGGHVILSPVNEWKVTATELQLNFRIAVVTNQIPSDILVAHYKNLDAQLLIEQALFGSDRLLTGVGMGDEVNYAIPLSRFNESGDPVEVLAEAGIQYQGGNIWRDSSGKVATINSWFVEIPTTVTL